jgi:hypothetical protein
LETQDWWRGPHQQKRDRKS